MERVNMSQSLSNILVHAVFRTKSPDILIHPEYLNMMHSFMGGIFRRLGCPALQVGGVEDHVHALFRLDKRLSVSETLQKVKANSSRWFRKNHLPHFAWQDGYGAFSIGQSQTIGLINYISGQDAHHRLRSCREEYLELLEKYEVEGYPKFIF